MYLTFTTGPPTHSVGGHTSNNRWHLLSVIVCPGL